VKALVLIVLLCSPNAFAQGSLYFANRAPGVDAPVTLWDGTNRIAGAAFVADLCWAPGIVTDSTLLMSLGQAVPFTTNGYFFGGLVAVPSVPGTTITVQVRVKTFFDCNSGDFAPWESCERGQSGLIQVIPSPAGFPSASLVGLKPFSLEPPLYCFWPGLTIVSQNGPDLLFSWPPYFYSALALQQSAELVATNWMTLTNRPELAGPNFQITLPKPAGTMFYRLVSK